MAVMWLATPLLNPDPFKKIQMVNFRIFFLKEKLIKFKIDYKVKSKFIDMVKNDFYFYLKQYKMNSKFCSYIKKSLLCIIHSS